MMTILLNSNNGTCTVNSITFSESGTVDSSLVTASLYSDTDNSYANGGTSLVDGPTAFSAGDGTVTLSAGLSTNAGVYLHLVVDVDGAAGGSTLLIDVDDKDSVDSTCAKEDATTWPLDGGTTNITTAPPSLTGYTNAGDAGLNNLGGRTGQSITISGSNMGAACDNADPETAIWIGGIDTGYEVLCGDVSSWAADSITFEINSAISSYGGAGASGISVETGGNSDSLDFAVYPNITSLTTPSVANAAREYDASDADGVITINGTRLGTGGTVTIAGESATVNSYLADAWEVQVPASISDSTYTGDIVLTRTTPADNLTHTFSGFRILPRTTALSPAAGCTGSSTSVMGNHLCQSGACPGDGSQATAADNVTFSVGQMVADVDVTAWSHTQIDVVVPGTAATGNVVVTSDTAYTTNGETFTVDSAPPVQSNWDPAKGSSTTTSPTITFDLNKNGDCKWSLTDDAYGAMGGDCTGDDTSSMSCITSGLAGGAEIVYIACQDTCGNADTAGTNEEVNYTVDTSPPVQSNWSPAKGSTTTNSPAITLDLDETGDCKWSLTDTDYDSMGGDCTGDGTINITCATSGLSAGAEIVYVACKDSAGNKDTAGTNEDINYTVDATVPTQSAWNPAKGSTLLASSVVHTFTLNETGDCKWSLTDQSYSAMANDCTGDGTTSMTCNVTGLAEGSNLLYTACKDTAGNMDTALTNEHSSYIVDTLPPVQSGWSPAGGSTVCATTQSTIFTLNEAGDCKWDTADLAYGAMSNDCTGDGTTSQTCVFTGLAVGANTVYISCKDSNAIADTNATNDSLSYTVDTSVPTQSGWNPAKSSTTTTSPTITFNLNKKGDCHWSLTDQDYASSGGDCSGDGSSIITCSTSGLSTGPEIVYVACQDTCSNADSAATNEHIDYTVDGSPPTQSNWNPPSGSSVGESQAMTLLLDEAGDCRWGLTDLGYASMGNGCSGGGTVNITCNVSGLTTGTANVYISCNDTAGNADTSGTNSLVTYTVSIPATPPDPGAVTFYNSPDPFANTEATNIYTEFATSTTKYDTQIEIWNTGQTEYVRRLYSGNAEPHLTGTLFFHNDHTVWDDDSGTPVDDNNVVQNPGTYVGRVKTGLTFTYDTKIEGSGLVMSNPSDIYLDQNDNLIFINDTTQIVEKINASGTVLFKFDAGDDGAGASPLGVAADSNDNVYVADTANDRIMKYDSDGLLVTAGYISVTSPRGLYVYNDYLYIAYDTNDIAKYDLSTAGQVWTSTTDDDPYDVAVGNVGGTVLVFVTVGPDDEINTYYDADGSTYTPDDSGLDSCDSPRGIDVDDRTNAQYLYIACEGTHYIQRYDISALANSITPDYSFGNGSAGGGDTQVNGAMGVTGLVDGDIVIADTGNNRLAKVTDTGAALVYDSLIEPDVYNLFEPTDMAIDGNGDIYAASYLGNYVKRFTKDGLWVATYGEAGAGSGQFSGVVGVAVWDEDDDGAADYMFAAEYRTGPDGRIQCYDINNDQWNNSSSGCGGIFGAAGITIGEPGGLGFDDTLNQVVAISQSNPGNQRLVSYDVDDQTGPHYTQGNGTVEDVAVDFNGYYLQVTSDANRKLWTEDSDSQAFICTGNQKSAIYGVTVDKFGNAYVSGEVPGTCAKIAKYSHYYGTPLDSGCTSSTNSALSLSMKHAPIPNSAIRTSPKPPPNSSRIFSPNRRSAWPWTSLSTCSA